MNEGWSATRARSSSVKKDALIDFCRKPNISVSSSSTTNTSGPGAHLGALSPLHPLHVPGNERGRVSHESALVVGQEGRLARLLPEAEHLGVVVLDHDHLALGSALPLLALHLRLQHFSP